LKTRIFEIFTSIEGEGILYGTKTLFVRLAGCPYSCFYCDTLDALPLDSGKEYSITEACNLIDTRILTRLTLLEVNHLFNTRLSMNLQNMLKLVVFQRISNLHVLIQKNFYTFYHQLTLLKLSSKQ